MNNKVVPDIDQDVLKLSVINRYQDAAPSVAFIKNFGLKKGALASSIAHDSHNIISVGCSDEEICKAINLVIKNKGGIAAVTDMEEMILPLPVAGIMSNEDGYTIAAQYSAIDLFAKNMGSTLRVYYNNACCAKS